MPTPETTFSTAPMPERHISPSANISNPLLNCPMPSTPTQAGRAPKSREHERTHTQQARGADQMGDRPSPRNAQTAWNGVWAGEEKGHLYGMTRHTHREERGGREGGQRREENRYRPRPPGPVSSAAHTRPGHCTCEGSSGTECYATAPRQGSLRASPWGSHWQQASSTGPAAPATRATTH